MSTRPTLMPDFVDALERDLRAASTAVTSRRARRRRRATLVTTVALGATAAVVAVSSLASTSPRAYAGPLIVEAPHVHDLRVARGLEAGLVARHLLGDGVRFDQLRRIPTDAGPAFAAGGTRGWCLSVPDAASPNPRVERGVACAVSAAFERIGLSVSVGGRFVAVLPQGVPAPTLKRPGGEPRPVAPSAYGTVSVRVRPGDVVTTYGRDGTRRASRIRGT